jgi:hypothetical protein
MTRRRFPLSAVLAQQIAAFVRAGGFPHVAATAAGVPRDLFARWLRRGTDPRTPALVRALCRDVLQAHAQARLKAEVAILADKPLDWLRYGPGKEKPGAPGWSAAARAQPPTPSEAEPLASPEFSAAVQRLLDVLAPFPEIRVAAARALRQGGERRR